MIGYGFKRPFYEALDFFKTKEMVLSPRSWRDVWQDAHSRSFTVARVTAMDVLEDIREEVQKALDSGTSLGQFKRDLRGTLERKGWFAPKKGKAVVKLPDGAVRKRLTGWRLNTIYQTNLQTAFSVGRHKQMVQSRTREYWQYMAIMDAATRPDHAAMHGKVYHRDHPFWDQWYPPNGFNCRCYVKTLSGRQMEQRGLKEEKKGVKEKPDEGFQYNPATEKWKPDLSKYSDTAKSKIKNGIKAPPVARSIEGASKNMREYAQTLSGAQKDAIKRYTEESYGYWNRELRKFKLPESAVDVEGINTLSATLKNAPKYEGRVFRTIATTEEQIGDFTKKLRKGNTVCFNGFTSTTTDRAVLADVEGVAFPGKKVIHMEIRGKSGVWVSDLSGAPLEESEVLFNKRSFFKVVSQKKGNVVLEELSFKGATPTGVVEMSGLLRRISFLFKQN